MFEQAAEVGVVHGLRRRRLLEFPRRVFIREDALEQAAQIFVFEFADDGHQLGEHLVDVVFGSGEVIGQAVFALLAEPHPMNRNLKVIAVDGDQAAREDYVVAVEGVYRLFKIVPPLPRDVTCLVRKRDERELPARLLISKLFRFDEEGRADGLIRGEIADEDFFHRRNLYLTRSARNNRKTPGKNKKREAAKTERPQRKWGGGKER